MRDLSISFLFSRPDAVFPPPPRKFLKVVKPLVVVHVDVISFSRFIVCIVYGINKFDICYKNSICHNTKVWFWSTNLDRTTFPFLNPVYNAMRFMSYAQVMHNSENFLNTCFVLLRTTMLSCIVLGNFEVDLMRVCGIIWLRFLAKTPTFFG